MSLFPLQVHRKIIFPCLLILAFAKCFAFNGIVMDITQLGLDMCFVVGCAACMSAFITATRPNRTELDQLIVWSQTQLFLA